MTEQKITPVSADEAKTSLWLMVRLAVAVFVFEFLVNALMYVILTESVQLPSGVEALIDSLVLTATLAPALYFLFLRPAYRQAKDLQKFELAIENASDHIIITDLDGVILYANRAAELTTGYSREEMLGAKPSLWGRQMDRDFYGKMWHTIKDEKKTFVGEIRNKRKNGEFYVAVASIAPVLGKGNDVEFFVGIERDVTKEKEIEKAKNDFISIASHQLRTPLTGIQWVIERFAKKEKLSVKGKEYLNDLHLSAKRLGELVSLLLNLSRLDAGNIGVTPEPLEIVGFVKSYLAECTPLFEKKKLKVVFKDHPDKLEVITDRNAMRNIIQSLVSNAIEYTPEKSMIEITIRNEGNKFAIKVKDNGIGISKADQANIFQKFMRAENAKLFKTDGTGLGLYIAKEATNLLGGDIWFESEEDQGSVFHVELPLKSKTKEGSRTLT
jgi:PAS domain S-box-containing protein